MTAPAAPPRVATDDLAYLRVRVWSRPAADGSVGVKLVDRLGNQVEGFLIFVPERHLISTADAKKAAGGGR